MKVLFDAIYSEYDNNAALKAAVTGLYLDVVPQNTSMPYLVFMLVTDIREDTFDTHIEDFLIQFSIFSDKSEVAEVADIFEKLKTCYDYCALTVTGYDHIEMRRQGANLLRDPSQAWHYVVEYKVLVQKQ